MPDFAKDNFVAAIQVLLGRDAKQSTVAERLGVSEPTLSKLKNGGSPREDTRRKIAKAVGLSLADFELPSEIFRERLTQSLPRQTRLDPLSDLAAIVQDERTLASIKVMNPTYKFYYYSSQGVIAVSYLTLTPSPKKGLEARLRNWDTSSEENPIVYRYVGGMFSIADFSYVALASETPLEEGLFMAFRTPVSREDAIFGHALVRAIKDGISRAATSAFVLKPCDPISEPGRSGDGLFGEFEEVALIARDRLSPRVVSYIKKAAGYLDVQP